MPRIGEHDLAGVKQDWLGGVTLLLLRAGVLQQAGDEVPEWIASQISLSEVKLSRAISSA